MSLNLTTEWDKVFPKSDIVDHKKAKIIITIVAAIILCIIFVIVAQNIIVNECGLPCSIDCGAEDCPLYGCARISLWDEIVCNIKQLFN